MKRFHIHINTTQTDFEKSITFYVNLFGEAPTKEREGYAKWMLDDPYINFVIEAEEHRLQGKGIHHIGLQVENGTALNAIKDNLKRSAAPLLEIGETQCCFSKSEKNWTMDPNGVKWETFHSFGDTEDYGEKTIKEVMNE
jgi:catechol 2,3-dioxygenase-like lactoylglutathione lyase family enzyme